MAKILSINNAGPYTKAAFIQRSLDNLISQIEDLYEDHPDVVNNIYLSIDDSGNRLKSLSSQLSVIEKGVGLWG